MKIPIVDFNGLKWSDLIGIQLYRDDGEYWEKWRHERLLLFWWQYGIDLLVEKHLFVLVCDWIICVLCCLLLLNFFPLHLLHIWGSNAARFARLLKTLLTAQGKNSWVQHTLCLCFYSSCSLSLCHSPPTVVFAPIVTTQQLALTPSDWWISCDGGGLCVRALSALKQLSFPIHIPSTAEEWAGAASAQDPKTKTILSVDV